MHITYESGRCKAGTDLARSYEAAAQRYASQYGGTVQWTGERYVVEA